MTSGLLEFATNEFELAKPQTGGGTLREHLEKDSQNKRKRHARLEMKAPPGADYLWTWFNEMVYGLEKLTSADIIAWQTLAGIELSPWEVQLMRRLDIARRNAR